MTFLFGSAEADRAFAFDCTRLLAGGVLMYAVFKLLLWCAKAITVRRQDNKARGVWR